MKLYTWDTAGLFTGEVEVDDFDPMPPRSTPTAPPEAEGVAAFKWVGHGWVAFHPSEVQPVDIDWLPLIADRRYQAETAGIELGDMHVATDDRSKLLINGAVVEAMLDPEYVMRWKTPGGFVDLAAQQVIAVARAVRAHVQACFDREAELQAAVADGSITADLLDQGWPA
ncbi:DUF4376 domain-containing protein [Pseudomonas sp. DTU_2021_1001937_2_SI_NGA_ILE_001]|uniref:DUF4376 domain-containing protein n=1 Tax=Pseudomonas sp. DTU_2021_1001937_2_SI_NGA_ILE_001 TaxID=3077589 RepID=UPI0028FC23D1|nr:DUF4376 domain-containing protein [Pseudomonas sp. DTU_2021_1001937_2_SI_NGA_ILE_001]WNW10136.1 DUF4376 domain-containing protein [Pseudomonas sp. DTU_2021_1001937_2_SI_NGA_ILE_001]